MAKPSERVLEKIGRKKKIVSKRLKNIRKPVTKSSIDIAKALANIKTRRIQVRLDLSKPRRNILSKTRFAEKITQNIEEAKIIPKPRVILNEKQKFIGRTRFI